MLVMLVSRVRRRMVWGRQRVGVGWGCSVLGSPDYASECVKPTHACPGRAQTLVSVGWVGVGVGGGL